MIDLPTRYAEIDHVEDVHAVILVLEPERTDGLTEFPPVDRIARATLPVDTFPDERGARNRFRIVQPKDAEVVVSTDDGTDLGLKYDADLTERVSQLAETVG